jgi:hypothetical protein
MVNNSFSQETIDLFGLDNLMLKVIQETLHFTQLTQMVWIVK